MKNIRKEWVYPATIEEAVQAQAEMAKLVSFQEYTDSPVWIGGMDVSNSLHDINKMIYASCVVVSQKDMQVVDHSSVKEKQTFPYIPGLLGFREVPGLIHAYQALKQKPDLIMLDGQGISHPRHFGIACHIGVLLDCPTIGVAKSILIGKPVHDLGYTAGSTSPLQWKGKTVGMLVRTKDGCNPLVVSIGHKIGLERAVELVLQACRGYRLPEPTRQAHLFANAARKNSRLV